MTTKPVVVGVDGSEESLRAVEWAALEAKRHSSPLRIVSAPAMVPRMHAYNASPAAIANALRGIAARALDAAITRSEEVAQGLTITTGLLSGPPALGVVESGAEASMLVVGARGAGGFAAMVLGSVSRYAAARAACPVVVVREESMAVHREIAVGIRDPAGHQPDAGVRVRGSGAAWRGASRRPYLVLVPVRAAPARGGRRVAADRPGPDRGRGRQQPGGRAERVAGRNTRACGSVMTLSTGIPARVLASYSARTDLVVLGRHGHPAGTGPGIGSIQHAVLDHAHGPVAVVPCGKDAIEAIRAEPHGIPRPHL